MVLFWPVEAVLSRRTMIVDGRSRQCVLILWERPSGGSFAPNAFDDENQIDLDVDPRLMRSASWRTRDALKPKWSLAKYNRLPVWPRMIQI